MKTDKATNATEPGVGSTEWLGPLPAARKPDANGAGWFTAGQMLAYGAQERAAERERCASICDGIGAGYAGEARRLQGQHATHAAGQRDGANECAATIRKA